MTTCRQINTTGDLAALLAHFAVLHRGGAILVNLRNRRDDLSTHDDDPGEWMLQVETIAGPIAWPVQPRHLDLFDRVDRVTRDDPRVTDLENAVVERDRRLATLTDVAWRGTRAALIQRDGGTS